MITSTRGVGDIVEHLLQVVRGLNGSPQEAVGRRLRATNKVKELRRDSKALQAMRATIRSRKGGACQVVNLHNEALLFSR